jgi:arginyl-tRNA synthetase
MEVLPLKNYLCNMDIEAEIIAHLELVLKDLYGIEGNTSLVLEKTKPIHEGDFTLVVFPLIALSKKSPEDTAHDIGSHLLNKAQVISHYNVIKGFLNLSVNPKVWFEFQQKNWQAPVQISRDTSSKIMVEYSSPNTNKPLHLGHIRNNLLGYSIAQILKANGNEVVMTNLVNDRGIHICKSMLAWQLFGQGETPESTQIKGDHLVGKYYVIFENALKEQTEPIIEKALTGNFKANLHPNQLRYEETYQKFLSAKDEKSKQKAIDTIKELVRNDSELMQSCQQMLRDWEAGDTAVRNLWETMNNWVYAGFNNTYQQLGVTFDQYYYESNTYTLGKDLVQEGLQKGVFYKKEDHSVWIDLSEDGLDHKLVQRADGTSVYITQDMGTADLKFNDHHIDKSIYVVGNEQDYHFKVLFLIMDKLGRSYARGMYHASYGMVDLPSGKMKSREGTVVDADDLIQEMIQTAKNKTEELGKTEGLNAIELQLLYEKLGLAALKFYILKVDPKKRMLFNPEESIDFQGDTGPFVIYSFARIQSMLRQAKDWKERISENIPLHAVEIENIKQLRLYPEILNKAAEEYSPALICHYVLELSKSFNRLYNEVSILKENNTHVRNFRLQLAYFNAETIKSSLRLLGIDTVDKM